MQDFAGKIAVITGGGTGMGRELAVQLAAEGAHVSMCDLSEENMAETAARARAAAPASDIRISTHTADVSDEAAMLVFRDEVLAAHDTDHVDLLFNNAGLSGGGSIFTDTREAWDRCFNVCFHGVRWGTLAFLDALVKSDEGHIVNTSSVNGFWASIGADRPHTAYSAAKFAVKGFTEALITDLAVNAPHVHASVVMPGHIGTNIVASSMNYGSRNLTDEERELGRARRPDVPRHGADDRRRCRNDHPRRRARRSLADPGRRRRAQARRSGARRPRSRVRRQASAR